MTSIVKGRRSGSSYAIEAQRIQASAKSGKYTSLETTVVNGASDTPLTTLVGGSTFFTPLDSSVANFVESYSDKTIRLKFRTGQNADTAVGDLKSIKVRANTTKTIDFIADITEIYISNASGADADIDVSAI